MAIIPRRNKNKGYVKFWRANKVHYGNVQVAYGAFVYRNREERACPLGPSLTTLRVGPSLE